MMASRSLTGRRSADHQAVGTTIPVDGGQWPAALVELFQTERTAFVRLAYLLTGQRAVAEEIVQDAFISTRQAWAGVRDPARYLRRTVVNRCRSWGRHQQVVRAHPIGRPEATSPEADELWDALGRLDPRRRAAVVLRYYVDLPHAEIAALLGCRPATVRTSIHRALAQLREGDRTMSDPTASGSRPGTEAFELEIRRMLARRAADVVDGPDNAPLPVAFSPAGITAGRPPRSSRRPGGHVMAAAAAAVLAAAGLGALILVPSGSTTTEAVAPTTDAPPATEAPPGEATGGPAPAAVTAVSLDTVLASIPPGVDPVAGPPIYTGSNGASPEAVARDYLGRRLPDLQPDLIPTDNAGPIVVYRWSVDERNYQAAGSLVVRNEPTGPAVTLATTDGITISSLQRTADGLAVLVLDDDPNRDLLAADVTTLGGTILGGGILGGDGGEDGPGPKDLGSAGVADGSPLSFELTLAPVPVLVRVQRVGGTMLSITEMAVEPTGFATACGGEPPVRIDVGSLLGPLQAGPAPQSSVEPLANQAVWHHPGPVNAIEIRWPPDPTRLALAAPEGVPPDQVMGQRLPAGAANGAQPGLSSGYVLGAVGPADAADGDPCSVVQIGIYGEPAAVEWWNTALSGEWSFGLPLTIADLDPAVGPDGSGAAQTTTELVIGSGRSTERPQVPDGACDGLPGAPPRQGTGDGAVGPSAEAALAAFLAGTASPADPPLPAAGYTEVVVDASSISYVVPGDRGPIVVVDVSRGPGGGWTVDRWAASPC